MTSAIVPAKERSLNPVSDDLWSGWRGNYIEDAWFNKAVLREWPCYIFLYNTVIKSELDAVIISSFKAVMNEKSMYVSASCFLCDTLSFNQTTAELNKERNEDFCFK